MEFVTGIHASLTVTPIGFINLLIFPLEPPFVVSSEMSQPLMDGLM